MSFPGLLFLLLVSSCLPVLSTPPGTAVGTQEGGLQIELDENKPMFKKFIGWLKKHHRTVAEVLSIYFSDVPVLGKLSQTVKLLPHAHPVESSLKALDVKLDIFRAEMKWDAWAAGAYQMPVNNIENAWNKYTELVGSGKEALGKEFFAFYSQYEDSTLLLHQFLTANPLSIVQNFGDLLAARLRCHEKDIKAQFLYINELMCKGNVLNEKYYEFKGTKTNARVNTARKIASQSASALFTSHKRCIADTTAYLKMDIFERIDDTKKHHEIEDSIKAFLVKTYDRYDWLVVAFTTHNSRHLPKIVKRHDLSGFTQVERGTVTVAVAKQVKGHHTLTAAVGKTITECMPSETTFCLDVVQQLRACQKKVAGKRLSQTYTAVHIFKKKRSHPSTNAVEAQDDEDEDSALPESSANFEDDPSLVPYLFVGKCGKILGNFIVLIKSDEEINGENPCTKVKCQHDGKCVVVSGTFIAMCECKYPYYGDHCEMSLESYERQLQQHTGDTSQSRAQSLGPTSGQSADRGSQKSTTSRSSKHGPQKSAKRRNQKGKPQKGTKRRNQKGKPQKGTKRRFQKRRPQKRRPQKGTKWRSQKQKPQQVAQGSPTNRGSSTSEQLSSLKGKDIQSYCGSLCDDKTIKPPIL